MYMKIENRSDGLFRRRGNGSYLIIAGPCSVESEEQMLRVASELAPAVPDILRGGIWKPRTRPNCFEGVGGKGLMWLKKAGEALGRPVCTEVATPLHVELCLSHGVDMLWVGARTTANPFSVQAIADALKGVDIPVMVKNPVSPDLSLWIGALERLANSGITQLAAGHRGFSELETGRYRNQPNWRIPIELKLNYPELPLICDPSHICGNRDHIQAVCQEALDLLFDGLMIEVHPDPDNALSDNGQQLLPRDFAGLIGCLKVKAEVSQDTDFQKRIATLREEIDKIDDGIVRLLAKRMKVAEEIGEYKQRNDVTVLQPSRINEIIQTRIAQGQKLNLSKEFIINLYELIHEEAVRHQEEML